MSVLKSKQSMSDLQFYDTAYKIRIAVTKFAMNEKYVPKRWRPVVGFKLIEYGEQLMEHVVTANEIRLDTPDELKGRQHHQKKAKIAIHLILDHLAFMIELLEFSPDTLQEVIAMCDKELSLISGWMRSDKERYKKLHSEQGETK